MDTIQRFPWQIGPFGCNPGDFWLAAAPDDSPLVLYVLSLRRFLLIEVTEDNDRRFDLTGNGRLIEMLCATDDQAKAREAQANSHRMRDAMQAGYPRDMWGRVLRIPDHIFTSQDIVERLKEPLSRASPGQDWYAQLTPPNN
jgi:hypothetical protein